MSKSRPLLGKLEEFALAADGVWPQHVDPYTGEVVTLAPTPEIVLSLIAVARAVAAWADIYRGVTMTTSQEAMLVAIEALRNGVAS